MIRVVIVYPEGEEENDEQVEKYRRHQAEGAFVFMGIVKGEVPVVHVGIKIQIFENKGVAGSSFIRVIASLHHGITAFLSSRASLVSAAIC